MAQYTFACGHQYYADPHSPVDIVAEEARHMADDHPAPQAVPAEEVVEVVAEAPPKAKAKPASKTSAKPKSKPKAATSSSSKGTSGTSSTPSGRVSQSEPEKPTTAGGFSGPFGSDPSKRDDEFALDLED